MKVSELIEQLQKMSQEKEVIMVWSKNAWFSQLKVDSVVDYENCVGIQ